MKVLNVHSRKFSVPNDTLVQLFETLSKDNDQIWPTAKWPSMQFKNGLKVGENGGHGPIRYSVNKYDPSGFVEFQFQKPKGFNGIHKLEIIKLSENKSEIKHTIEMLTNFKATILWIFAIRSLHDALLEDALDKVESYTTTKTVSTPWSIWVRFLRFVLS